MPACTWLVSELRSPEFLRSKVRRTYVFLFTAVLPSLLSSMDGGTDNTAEEDPLSPIEGSVRTVSPSSASTSSMTAGDADSDADPELRSFLAEDDDAGPRKHLNRTKIAFFGSKRGVWVSHSRLLCLVMVLDLMTMSVQVSSLLPPSTPQSCFTARRRSDSLLKGLGSLPVLLYVESSPQSAGDEPSAIVPWLRLFSLSLSHAHAHNRGCALAHKVETVNSCIFSAGENKRRTSTSLSLSLRGGRAAACRVCRRKQQATLVNHATALWIMLTPPCPVL